MSAVEKKNWFCSMFWNIFRKSFTNKLKHEKLNKVFLNKKSKKPFTKVEFMWLTHKSDK